MRRTDAADRRALRKYRQAVADKAWSSEVKLRAGLRCERCGKGPGGLAAHHIFSRSLKSVRTYPPNGVCLCNGDHMFYAHKYPHMFLDWMVIRRGQPWFDDLNIKANTRKQVFTAADEPKIN